MKNWYQLVCLCGLAAGVSAYAQAPAFTPGNLAVLRLGNGTETLSSSGNTVYIDQYSTNGFFLTSVALPNNANTAILLSGVASSEGGLTRSLDRTVLTIAGYRTNLGALSSSLSSTLGTAVPREVATLDAFGNYYLFQYSSSLYSASNIRCAATDGTNGFWTAGGNLGTFYLSPGNDPAIVQSVIANTRYVKAINGALYFSTQAGTPGIYTFPEGLPRGGTATNLLVGTGSSSQIAGFDLNSTATVAYVADQRSTAGGIQKWVNSAGAWSLAYTFSTGAGAYAVAVDFSGASPIIYAITGESVSNRMVLIVDSNATAVVTTIAVAGANRYFRGLDFVPDLRPLIVSQPQSQVATNGANVSFNVQASSPFALGYQWQKNGTNLAGATTSSLALASVGATNQGAYQVVVTNQYAAITSASATLTISVSLTPPTLTAPPQAQAAPIGGNATLTVSATGTLPLAYQWRLNSVNLPGQTTSSLALTCLSPEAQGLYSVSVTNVAGTTNSQPVLLTVVTPTSSFVPYTNPGSVYAQNFDSLPNPGLASIDANNPVTVNGTTYSLTNPFDFAFPAISCLTGIGGLGLSGAMAGWYGEGALAGKLGASSGDQSTGGVISFGSTNSTSASTNRALGLLATSSTGGTAFGLKLLNATTNTLTRMNVQFTGELWRQAAVPKALEFSYWIDLFATNGFPTNLTASLTNLNVTFPTNPAATTPIPADGTVAGNQVQLGVVNQAITNWPPGAALWLVWSMADATGKGQGLGIDNLTFSATVVPSLIPVTLSIRTAGTNVVLAWPGVTSNGVLQANSSLLPAGAWTTVTQPWQVVGGSNTVTLPIGASPQYFRLVP